MLLNLKANEQIHHPREAVAQPSELADQTGGAIDNLIVELVEREKLLKQEGPVWVNVRQLLKREREIFHLYDDGARKLGRAMVFLPHQWPAPGDVAPNFDPP